ncbi:MAG: hypothetical protein ABEL04_09935 [Salinibacter sp.]|uniref:hypothetical protein n=1 Tax=Salinibacter sp. TaxID=2065818 RepID=UPI0035D407AE
MSSTMSDAFFPYVIGGVLSLLLVAAGPARGQQLPEGLQGGGTSYYTFARPGQNTIQVLLLGDVGQTGLYKIGENIDLARLLALSGGTGDVRTRGRFSFGRGDTKIRLYRPANGGRELIFKAELDQLVSKSDYPDLKSGDVIRVENQRPFPWFDVFQILTSAATFTLTIIRFIRE